MTITSAVAISSQAVSPAFTSAIPCPPVVDHDRRARRSARTRLDRDCATSGAAQSAPSGCRCRSPAGGIRSRCGYAGAGRLAPRGGSRRRAPPRHRRADAHELLAQPREVRLEPERVGVGHVRPAGREQLVVRHDLAEALDQRASSRNSMAVAGTSAALPADLVAARSSSQPSSRRADAGCGRGPRRRHDGADARQQLVDGRACGRSRRRRGRAARRRRAVALARRRR